MIRPPDQKEELFVGIALEHREILFVRQYAKMARDDCFFDHGVLDERANLPGLVLRANEQSLLSRSEAHVEAVRSENTETAVISSE